MDKKYALVLKTAEAEIKALENTNEKVLDCIFPIIELTRGRKLPVRKGNPTPEELYPFNNRLQKIKDVFCKKVVCFDLTSDDSLMSNQISSLYNPSNGYENWVNFLVNLKNEDIFKEIMPSVILNVEDIEFEKNLLLQVQSLKRNFSTLVYRNVIIDENCYQDFELLKTELLNTKLIVIIDSEYVVQAAQHVYEEKIYARVTNLQKVLKQDTKYVISSTSFPNNISEIGNDSSDTFKLCEVDIFKFLENKNTKNIIYSDYGSINPKRNDAIVMARGWIPRIDVPLSNEIFYYRQRRPKGISQYSDTYNIVAKQVTRDSRFPSSLDFNWGILQILNCSNGDSPASNPAFWISVRMCIHIEQQVRRLKLLD